MANRRGHKHKPKTPLHKKNGAKPKEGRLRSSSRAGQSSQSAPGVTNEDSPTGDTSSWGKGGILTNTSNPSEVSKDLSLIERALKNRWGIRKKELIQDRLLKVLNKEEVTVATKDGPVTVEEPADRNAVAAARVLVQMNGQDIECEQFEIKSGKPTTPGTVVNVINASESASKPGASRILQLAHSLGARELIIDGEAIPTVSTSNSVRESEEA